MPWTPVNEPELQSTSLVGTGRKDVAGKIPGFDLLDLNGDGLISKEELVAATGEASEVVERVLDAIDVNGDGVISREEYAAAHTAGCE